jgi:hypothetical protein
LAHALSNLRSAEAALQLFASLKELRSGGALRARMLSKSNDIVLQFGREVDATATLFETDKVIMSFPSSPPTYLPAPSLHAPTLTDSCMNLL